MSLFGKKNPDPLDDNAEPERHARPGSRYSIEEAIQLMRTLPLDHHPDLVVLVIKNTLASMNVNLTDTIRDAAAKQEALGQEISSLMTSISDHEEQIRLRKQDVTALEAELAEVTRVRQRLEAAGAPEAPKIVPPTVPVRSPSSVVAARPPPPRSKPSTLSPPKETTDAIELRESAFEMESAPDAGTPER